MADLEWRLVCGPTGAFYEVASTPSNIYTIVPDGIDHALVVTVGPKGHVRGVSVSRAKEIAQERADA